jgi:hypothetical protein
MERTPPDADTGPDESQPTTAMSGEDGAVRLNEIQDQIGRGEYRVNTHAVADAIIRRLLQEQKTASAHKRDHDECS